MSLLSSNVLNPFATADEAWIESFLRLACLNGATHAERSEWEDQIEALVPALVELRNGKHLVLTAQSFVEWGDAAGFQRLAHDIRLSPLNRQRCRAIWNRLLVQGLRATPHWPS